MKQDEQYTVVGLMEKYLFMSLMTLYARTEIMWLGVYFFETGSVTFLTF